MITNFLDEVVNDYEKLFSSGSNYDVIIEAGENGDTKKFHAHSLILSSRSTYFKAALSNNWAHKENGKIVFTKPNISPKTMELLLKYIYTGNTDLDEQRGIEVLKYFVASDELDFWNLSEYIESYIIEKQANFLNEDPIEVLQTVFQYESLATLKDFYLRLICDNPEILFESPEFSTIDRFLLILLIQRDDLNMEEYEIWEYILEWGKAQMPDVNIDHSTWTSENFIELRGILRDFIPLIRWTQISSKLFSQKISSFKKVFPENIYADIIGYYLDSDSPPKSLRFLKPRNPSLKIINKKHFSIISSWIDNKEKAEYYNIKNNPYSLELLYSATRDGFDPTKFHELCDNKGPTIMIAKVKYTGKLIGEYNPKSLNSHDFLFPFANQDVNLESWNSHSFLFSFGDANLESWNPPMIARCDPMDLDIHMHDVSEPSTINLSNFIIRDNNTIECVPTQSFPEIKSFIDTKQKYLIEGYEVFKVIKPRKLVINNKTVIKGKINSIITIFLDASDSLVIIFQKSKIDKIYSIVKFILKTCAKVLVIIFQKDTINSRLEFARDPIIGILQQRTNSTVITNQYVIDFFIIYFLFYFLLLFINSFHKLDLAFAKFVSIFTFAIYIYLKI